MKLLLDENVSPSLVAEFWKQGVDTTSIRDRGKLGLPDHEVLRHAVDDDRVIVTANAADFTALCGGVELHPGLVTIASGTRNEQRAMIDAALVHIERLAGFAERSAREFMVNRVVEVALDMKCASFRLPTIAASSTDEECQGA